jgi:Domain of unknown function (DUF4192)
MQTIVSGAGPRDAIALAWYRLGFRPRESLVLIGLHGPKRRTGALARADLPAPEHRAPTLASMVPYLQRCGDRQVVVLVVSDVDGGPRAGAGGEVLLPHRDLVAWLGPQLRRHGIEMFDALAVGPSTFRSYLCEDTTCCPPQGESLELVASSELAAHMVLDGKTFAPREEDVVADVRPVADGRVTARRLRRMPEPDLGQVLRGWREQLAGGADEPGDPAELLVAMRHVLLRDAVMFTLIPGSGLMPEAVLNGDLEQAEADAAPWNHPPDDDLAERGRRLLAALARVAPPGDRAEPLALLAWLAWWCNDTVRCRLLVDLALADRPGHRLARLVAQLHAAAVPPTWWRLPG